MVHTIGFPTSYDIYIEKNGCKIGIVRSYSSKKVNSEYELKIDKVYYSEDGIKNGFDFSGIDDFLFVVQKPDRTITYYNCKWIDLGDNSENAIAIATERREKVNK